MFKLINNFFNHRKNNLFKKNILDIQKNFPVKKIFDAIKSFSSESDVYYVGGCIRKTFCHELVDDIDLATNINPDEVILSLKKNDISFYETGKNHGTITAIIDDKKFDEYSLKQNTNTKNSILKTYDLLLNSKYDVVMNEKAIERVKNFFK